MSVSTLSDFKWSAKGDWQISVYSSMLCEHVQKGGAGHDQVGGEIIDKLIAAKMQSPDFRELCIRHKFNNQDLHNVVSTAIAAGLDGDLPGVFIKDGGPRLLACVLIDKKSAITEIMTRVLMTESEHIAAAKKAHPDIIEPGLIAMVGRDAAVTKATLEVGKLHYDFITKTNGPEETTVDSNGKGLPSSQPPGGGCGCASLIVLGGIILSSGAVASALLSALLQGF